MATGIRADLQLQYSLRNHLMRSVKNDIRVKAFVGTSLRPGLYEPRLIDLGHNSIRAPQALTVAWLLVH